MNSISSSFLTLRSVCDLGGYSVVERKGYSQLQVYWVVQSLGKVAVVVSRFFVNLGEIVFSDRKQKHQEKV